MRHRRTRFWFKLILASFFAAAALLFAEHRIALFLPHLKEYAAARVEAQFDNRVRITFGSVDGGIVRPLILNDVTIRDRENNALFPAVRIDNIRTTFRLIDLVAGGRDLSLATLLDESGYVAVNFVSPDGRIKGFVGIAGDLDRARIRGSVIWNGEKIEWLGLIVRRTFTLETRSRLGRIHFDGSVGADGTVKLNFRTGRITYAGLDIVAAGTTTNRLVPSAVVPGRYGVQGEIATTMLLLRGKPLPAVRASYSFADGVLTLSSCAFGDDIRLTGTAKLAAPYPIDGVLTIDRVSLPWLLATAGVTGSSGCGGTVSARIACTGALAAPQWDATITAENGAILSLGFDHLSLHLVGEGPLVRIEDSLVTRESGSLSFAGEMDVRKIGRDTVFRDVRINDDGKVMVWDDWRTTAGRGGSETTMQKRLTDDIALDYKNYTADPKADASSRYRDEAKLEYRLQENDSLTVRVGQYNDFVGFEHKNKF